MVHCSMVGGRFLTPIRAPGAWIRRLKSRLQGRSRAWRAVAAAPILVLQAVTAWPTRHK